MVFSTTSLFAPGGGETRYAGKEETFVTEGEVTLSLLRSNLLIYHFFCFVYQLHEVIQRETMWDSPRPELTLLRTELCWEEKTTLTLDVTLRCMKTELEQTGRRVGREPLHAEQTVVLPRLGPPEAGSWCSVCSVGSFSAPDLKSICYLCSLLPSSGNSAPFVPIILPRLLASSTPSPIQPAPALPSSGGWPPWTALPASLEGWLLLGRGRRWGARGERRWGICSPLPPCPAEAVPLHDPAGLGTFMASLYC